MRLAYYRASTSALQTVADPCYERKSLDIELSQTRY